MDYFQNDYHVIAVDMIGHGGTIISDSEYKNEYAFAEQMKGILEAFGKDQYIAVGHSLGGCFIEQYIDKYGTDKLSKAALMDSTPSFNVVDDWTYTAAGEFGGREWAEKNFDAMLEYAAAEKGFETALLYACQTDNRKAFEKLNIPTYYFYPMHDTATMADQEGLIQWIKDNTTPEYVEIIAINSDNHSFPLKEYAQDETVTYLKELFEK